MNKHDVLCPLIDGPCCPWMGDCDCQCQCDWIVRVREDQHKRSIESAKTIVAGLYIFGYDRLLKSLDGLKS